MPNYNKVILVGHAVQAPEVHYSQTGTAFGSFTIAVNRSWAGKDGQKQDETAFIPVQIWGKVAELVGNMVRKGSCVMIDGRLSLSTWNDKTTGKQRSRLQVTLENFQMLSSSGNSNQGQAAKTPPEGQKQPSKSNFNQPGVNAPPVSNNPDLPF